MSRLFEGVRQIEQAREQLQGASFMAGLFQGRPDFRLLSPAPETAAEKARCEAYCQQLAEFLQAEVDPLEIERTGIISDKVIKGLFELGAFAMKIPKRYGGLGFSHKHYGRALTLIASWSNVLSLTVAVPQSIGIAMPILLYGNEAQKQQYLPQVARGELSAFALTEPATGSDAANVQTEAVLVAEEDVFVVNGQKLWCTNGAIARYITLIARVPVRRERGEQSAWQPVGQGERADASVHTAFILDMQSPGVKVRQRCQFGGCRGIANAHIVLENVRIHRDQVIGEIGAGLRYALSILNIGRAVSVPAICLGMAKQAWQPTLDRLNSRVTFGEPLAKRQTQRIRVGEMAMRLFVMEALAERVWHMADQQHYDVRMEAAVTKMLCSEQSLQFLNDAQIIFGGMGYETAASKQVRGEPAFPLEQLVRDATMYRIGEGATDILRPFVAREGLNFHLQQARDLLEGGWQGRQLLQAAGFYLPWYVSQWWPHRRAAGIDEASSRRLRHILGFVESRSRRLARAIFYAVVVRREQLQFDQGRQNRIEMLGESLLALAASALQAEALDDAAAWRLVEYYHRAEKKHIHRLLREMISNDDRSREQLGKEALEGRFSLLGQGIIERGLDDYAQMAMPEHGSDNAQTEEQQGQRQG